MGYWGCGNFDGDDPREFLADLVAVWERIIDRALAGESEEVAAYFGPGARPFSGRGQEAVDALAMPTAEVLIAVAEKFECDYLPGPEKVRGWKAESLRIYDTEGADSWDEPERRRAIAETFGRLLSIVEGRGPAAGDGCDPDRG